MNTPIATISAKYIHSGDRTHHHDHVMAPNSFSPVKTRARKIKPPGNVHPASSFLVIGQSFHECHYELGGQVRDD